MDTVEKKRVGGIERRAPKYTHDPMDSSMPGLPVHHQCLEFAQTHVHQVSDAIQPSFFYSIKGKKTNIMCINCNSIKKKNFNEKVKMMYVYINKFIMIVDLKSQLLHSSPN